MLLNHTDETASSQTIGTILCVVIVIVLALLVLLLFHMPSLEWDDGRIPAIIIITSIQDIDEITGKNNHDSRVILLHSGIQPFVNKNLIAKFYRNEVPVNCNILTLNGHDFISTSHTGVQWIDGSGYSGATWDPGERVTIDFSDGTYKKEDTIRVDIIDKKTNRIVSRHSFSF